MKQFYAFALAALLCVSLAACGCSNSAPATMPSVTPTIPTTMPATLPPLETNIPDPDVDPYATEPTDTIPGTERAKRQFKENFMK